MPQPVQVMLECQPLPAFDTNRTTLVDSSHKLIAEQTCTITQLTAAARDLKAKCDPMDQVYPKASSEDLYQDAL
eukprot:8330569-Karenia_brevis.AAC.1